MPLSPLVLIVLALSAAPEPAHEETFAADLDGDGRLDRLVMRGAADRSRAFFQLDPASGGAFTSPLYPAWKAVPARLDGGAQALVLGTWTTKRTRPGEPPRRSIWVVGFEAGRWVERWRGSALARPFTDFTMRDLDGDGTDELVVRECEGPEQGYAAYSWRGFGFSGRARLKAACTDDRPQWQGLRLEGGRLWRRD